MKRANRVFKRRRSRLYWSKARVFAFIGVTFNRKKLHQVEVFLPATLRFWVMFNPNDLIRLQAVLATHSRCEMLREVGNGSARIVWQLRCDEDIFPVASPMHLNVTARIAVP